MIIRKTFVKLTKIKLFGRKNFCEFNIFVGGTFSPPNLWVWVLSPVNGGKL